MAEMADVSSPPKEGCPLYFKNMLVRTVVEDKVILGPATGHIAGGTMCALMGPSGAGKTTLLRALSRVSQSEVTVEGEMSDLPSGITSFVTQDDKINPAQTARACVRFYARLRLPRDSTNQEIEERVKNSLDKVKMLEKADQVVGGPFGFKTILGMSGGERRRVSIACGIVTSPKVLYLDEPTTGLDASTALTIGNVLRGLSTEDKTTIICTIHQPRQELFEMFDQCILLSGGLKVYDGPASSLGSHFEALSGEKKEDGLSVSDFAVDYMANASVEATEKVIALQKKQDDLLDITEDMKEGAWLESNGASLTIARQPGWAECTMILLRSFLADKFFSPEWVMMTFLKIVQVLPFINGHANRKLTSDLLMGFLMLVVTTTAVAGFQALAGFRAIGESFAEGGLCTLSQYMLALMFADFIMAWLSTLLLQCLFSVISWTVASVWLWLYGYAVLVLSWTFSFLIGYVSLGIFLEPIGALVLNNVVVFVYLTFSGFLRNKGDMEYGLGKAYEINPIYWAYEVLVMTQTEMDVPDETTNYTRPIWMLFAGIAVYSALAQVLIAVDAHRRLDRLFRSGSAYMESAAEEEEMEKVPLVTGSNSGSTGGTFDSSSSPASKLAVVTWKDLKYTVKTKEGDKPVLKGLSGQILEGSICAIMGSSGAGKTSLLRILSGSIKQQDDNVIEGHKTLIPSQKLGFVMQDAVVRPHMRAEEMVRFYGRLKLPMPRQPELDSLVYEALDMVSLLDKKATLVGGMSGVSQVQGLSGGQRRRVAIACAIVAQPEVLMLDEPTSGLDSAMSFFLTKTLVKIANTGVTIGLSIHQPRFEVYKLFHQIVLLSEGHIVYDGSPADATTYFGALFTPNPDINPADFVIDCCVAGGKTGEELSASWASSEQAQSVTEKPNKDMGTEQSDDDSFTGDSNPFEGRPGFMTRFWVIFQVEITNVIRSSSTYSKIFSFVALGFLIGIVDAQLFKKSVDTENFPFITRALTFISTFATFFLMFSNMYNMSALRSFMSECATGLFNGTEAWMALQLTDILCSLIAVSLYFLAVAWPTGLMEHTEAALVYYFGIILLTLYFAFSILGLITFAPSSLPMDFLTFQPPMLSLLYGGVWLPQQYIFRPFRWIQYISPTKYLFNASMQAVYGSMDFKSCYETSCELCDMCIDKWRIFHPYKAQFGSVATNIGALVPFIAGASVLSWFLVRNAINKNKYIVDVMLGPGKFKPPGPSG
eukprot:CAMPEP_0170143106 /NCGR_PEP_ID=MMETSP0033_2-20121228/9425_1 /TAXON_ID=195969 /ORGANISM="Dolichomastix tenuilepis, Strain CCMP3274" /LENGTH=1220 /DNA_ID=CAMNT_0010379531 /DNA_START=39 /DNA_END=3701 /DNA_ORIENTATION=+